MKKQSQGHPVSVCHPVRVYLCPQLTSSAYQRSKTSRASSTKASHMPIVKAHTTHKSQCPDF